LLVFRTAVPSPANSQGGYAPGSNARQLPSIGLTAGQGLVGVCRVDVGGQSLPDQWICPMRGESWKHSMMCIEGEVTVPCSQKAYYEVKPAMKRGV